MLRTDGEEISVLKRVKRITLEDREYLLESFIDITDIKKMQEKAGKETAMLSAMISGMEEGVVFADVDNIIVKVNEYFCRFVGVEQNNILGRRLEEFHSGKILERVMDYISRFRESSDSKAIIIQRAIGDSGVLLRLQPVFRAGRYDGILLNVINVTDLVEARKAAEAASKAKSEFLANMEP